MGSTCRAVSNDRHINLHCFDVSDGILQRFTLPDTADISSEVHDICREPALSQLKRDPGSCRTFKKQIDDGFALQRRNFLDRSFQHLTKRGGSIHDLLNILLRETIKTQQMPL